MLNSKQIPVYLFTGFLESGKTSGIQGTLEDKRFYEGNEKTLLLICEEGEKEYNLKKIPSAYMSTQKVENLDMLTTKYLSDLEKRYKIDRVVIEYNGMWNIDTLYNNLPDNWFVFQEMTFADSRTFFSYNKNMRNLTVDKIKGCQMIVFNRVDDNTDKQEIHKIVRGISRSCLIAYEYPDEHLEYDDVIDPLPFDIAADIIEIADKDYAIWYRDFSEEQEKYKDKTVRFKGIIGKNSSLPENSAIIGRYIMTCCIDDIAFRGFACIFDEKEIELQNKDWVTITARIRNEYHPVYSANGPVLHIISADLSLPPEEEIATFY